MSSSEYNYSPANQAGTTYMNAHIKWKNDSQLYNRKDNVHKIME